MTATLYTTDFYAWTQRQAQLLRHEAFEEIDWQNLAEEIESLGRSEKRELSNRLRVLILHLLKWQWQPEYRSRSWRSSIHVQRRDLGRLLKDNPSLRPTIGDVVKDVYSEAAEEAVEEMGLLRSPFPSACPYLVEQIFDSEFWPE